MTNLAKISATSSYYDGSDFPEAAHYTEYVAERLRADYPGAEVDVSEGPNTRAYVYDDDGHSVDGAELAELEHEIATAIGVTYWADFCESGYLARRTQK